MYVCIDFLSISIKKKLSVILSFALLLLYNIISTIFSIKKNNNTTKLSLQII